MANTAIKLSALPYSTSIKSTDRFVVVSNTTGVPLDVLVSMGSVSSNLILSNAAPANSSSNGLAGTMAYDTNYVYICVANNTWRRASLGSY